MDTRNSTDLPAGLERLRQRLERWRQTHKPPSRIPNSLWSAAVTMANTYGVNRTARTLRFDYYSLKKRVDRGTAATSDTKPVPMPFVELANLPTAGLCLCRLELENADGVKMRVQLRSVAMPDLAAISRSFWDRQP
jgi:hypothetical protein